MRRELLAVLACPVCRGDLALAEVRREQGAHVLAGTLWCASCSQPYAIESGIPRLVEAEEAVRSTGRRFDFQWFSRWTGRFEDEDRCYGMSQTGYVAWIDERLTEACAARPGDWLLDCGCGSGEKTALLAGRHPEQRVVGMDLGFNALEKAAARHRGAANLDYVQGNVLQPPLKPGTFRWGVCIGVLHHTPDTRRAFAQFRRLLTDQAATLLWIYPRYREAPEWMSLYFIRDVLFLGQSHRLPPAFLRAASIFLSCALLPISLPQWYFLVRRMSKKLPFFDPRHTTLGEQVKGIIFNMFDTLLPRYQFRHSRRQVEKWFREERLEPLYYAHGYYVAATPKAATPAQRLMAAAEAVR